MYDLGITVAFHNIGMYILYLPTYLNENVVKLRDLLRFVFWHHRLVRTGTLLLDHRFCN